MMLLMATPNSEASTLVEIRSGETLEQPLISSSILFQSDRLEGFICVRFCTSTDREEYTVYHSR